MPTVADGWAQSGKLSRGEVYYVKEITPGKGYELDTNFYEVTINSDNVDLWVVEKPQNDPIGTLLAKYDGDKSYDAANLPQGSASLALSHWQLNYYSDYHSTTDTTWTQSATPVRSWIMQTDEDGVVDLRYGDSTFTTKDGVAHPYKVSGGDFYRMSDGRITLPLGTVTLQEIKAPAGYLLPDPNPIYASQITSDGALEIVDTYNMPITPEPVKRGDIAIMKFGEQTPDPEGQPSIKVPLENVAFDIINLSEQSVVRPDNTQAATGEVVVSIKTDAQGHASTEALAAAGKSGALAFGTYRVHEDVTTTPAGFDPVDDFVVTVAEDGKVLRYIAEDKITMTPVKVIKKDAETNKQIPAFVTYKLLDADKNPITMTTHYPQETIYETFTAAKDGTLTFPEKLTVGTYYLQETQAPEGYTKNPALISFSVTESHNWIDPIEVEFPDTPIKGKVEIIKTDKVDSTPVVGAVYAITATADITTPDGTVRAKKDQIMGSVTTDKDGKASLDGLYLGTYAATETQVPDGYALDTTPHPFVLTSEGQDVPVVITSLALTNDPTQVIVNKVSALDGKPLAGVGYSIDQAPDMSKATYATDSILDAVSTLYTPVVPNEKQAENAPKVSATYVDKAAADAALAAATAGDTVKLDVTITTTVAEQTPTEEVKTIEVVFGDASTKTLTIKSGKVTSVIDPHLNQELRHYEGVTDADGRISVSKILRGSYILTEAKTLPGYVRDTTAYPFVVDENGLIDGAAAKTFEFANDVTKVHVFKRASEGAELADAKLQIRDAHDALIEEWVSDGKAHLIQALPVGDYTLVELAAPQGYKVADPVKFTVTETATIQEVVMVDEVAPEMPTTGDKTLTLLLIGLGIVGVLAGGVGTAIAVRKMHKDGAASQNSE
ncbi:MAG: SpaA isopeptide-forming pilin-related protein [Raoultibacter sp.]